ELLDVPLFLSLHNLCATLKVHFAFCSDIQASFARAVASLSKAQAKKVARFLPNPERHWGPKLRAGRSVTSKHASLLAQKQLMKF
nr:tRNA (guanine(26)-N(2))-dimethyltransferase [Tanacetum cinerariifolium]